jgi:hypothetical protein
VHLLSPRCCCPTVRGDCLAAKLRLGNVPTKQGMAEQWSRKGAPG